MKLYKNHQAQKKLNEKIEKDRGALNSPEQNETIIIYEESNFLTGLKSFIKNIFYIICILGFGLGLSVLAYYVLSLF